MEIVSTEMSLYLQSSLVKKQKDNPPLVIFTKESMDADKPIMVVSLPILVFVVGSTNLVKHETCRDTDTRNDHYEWSLQWAYHWKRLCQIVERMPEMS